MPKKEEGTQTKAKTDKQVLRENNELLHEIHKHLKQQRVLHTVWMVVKILFLVVPLIAGIIYVPRVVNQFMEQSDAYNPQELMEKMIQEQMQQGAPPPTDPNGEPIDPEEYLNDLYEEQGLEDL